MALFDKINAFQMYSTGHFQGCTSLESVSLPKSLVYSGRQTFSGCTALSSVHGSEFIETMRAQVFENCSSLVHLRLNGVKEFSQGAFTSLTKLSRVFIPNAETLQGGVFQNMSTTLTLIDIGRKCTEMIKGNSNNVFYGFSSTNTKQRVVMVCRAVVPPSITAFSNTASWRPNAIYVPQASLSAYKSASVWSTYEANIFAIGGSEWQDEYADASVPSSEYADIECNLDGFYDYDELVAAYEGR